MYKHQLHKITSNFNFEGTLTDAIPFGNGHINDTYRLTFDTLTGRKQYLLQQIDHTIFTDPVGLMENISGVTAWLKKKIIADGGNPDRETLTIIHTKHDMPYYRDSTGRYWRSYLFIENTISYERVTDASVFYQVGLSFGHFQQLLSDYPACTLHETILNFHNTTTRFDQLKKAVESDICNRAETVRAEIRFAFQREALTHRLLDLQLSKALPLRVTHNDTKLNNILIDTETNKGLCIIDLDTVMPGLAANDFGDAIRSGASTAAEDETDLSKVSLDLDLFDAYTKGYIRGCCSSLTQKELDTLPDGALLMTFECGIRFLTDYLEGDHYFKTHREGHNLDRCRTQFKLVADMEEKYDKMKEIVRKYAKNHLKKI